MTKARGAFEYSMYLVCANVEDELGKILSEEQTTMLLCLFQDHASRVCELLLEYMSAGKSDPNKFTFDTGMVVLHYRYEFKIRESVPAFQKQVLKIFRTYSNKMSHVCDIVS